MTKSRVGSLDELWIKDLEYTKLTRSATECEALLSFHMIISINE